MTTDLIVEGAAESGVSRWVVGSAVGGTLVLAVGAFWLSFTTLQDLALSAGIPKQQAWIWPLIVDGVILQATISVVALRSAPARGRRFAWLLLGAGAAVSVAANITHAMVTTVAELPSVIAAAIASIPPLVLLAMTHLTVELTKQGPASTTPSSWRTQAVKEIAPSFLDSPRDIPMLPGETTVENPDDEAHVLSAGSKRAQAALLAAQGVSRREIGRQLGVHPTTVGRWLTPKPARKPFSNAAEETTIEEER